MATVVGFYGLSAASLLFLPVPGGVGVLAVMLIIILLTIPLVLVAEFDPTKRKG